GVEPLSRTTDSHTGPICLLEVAAAPAVGTARGHDRASPPWCPKIPWGPAAFGRIRRAASGGSPSLRLAVPAGPRRSPDRERGHPDKSAAGRRRHPPSLP